MRIDKDDFKMLAMLFPKMTVKELMELLEKYSK